MPPLPRVLALLALAVGALLALLHAAQTLQLVAGLEEVAVQIDARAFLGAGDLVAQGRGAELYDLAAQAEVQRARFPQVDGVDRVLVFANPPFVALPYAVLSGLETRTALLLCGLACLIELGLAATLATALLGGARRAGWVLLGLASFLPAAITLWQGQSSALLLAAWLGAWLAFERGRPTLGGACLALLAIKPQLLLVALVALVAARRWRALGGLALGGAFLLLVGTAVSGVDGWPAWLSLGRELVEGGAAHGIRPRQMVTIRSLMQVLAETDSFAPVRIPWLVAVALGVGTAGFVAHLTRLRDPWGLDWAALAVLALLISPHAYTHDLTLLAVAAVALGRAAMARDDLALGAALGLAVAWFVPYAVTVPGLPISAASVPAMALIYGLLVMAARERAVAEV